MWYKYNEHSQEIEESQDVSTSFSTDIIFTAVDHDTISWSSWQVITSWWVFKQVDAWTFDISWITYISFDGTSVLKKSIDINSIQWNILLTTAQNVAIWNNVIFNSEAWPSNSVLIWTNNIEPDAVTNSKIIDNAITSSKIASDAVVTTKILDGNVTPAKLSFQTVEVTTVLGKEWFELMWIRLESDGTDLFWAWIKIN